MKNIQFHSISCFSETNDINSLLNTVYNTVDTITKLTFISIARYILKTHSMQLPVIKLN